MSDTYDLVGVRPLGSKRWLAHPSKRTWRLRYALGSGLKVGSIALCHMRKVAGHLVHHFSICRPALPCLCKIYQFIGNGTGGPKQLDRAMRTGLEVCRGLVPIVHADLGRPFLNRAFTAVMHPTLGMHCMSHQPARLSSLRPHAGASAGVFKNPSPTFCSAS